MQLDGALADLLALVHTHGTVHPDISRRVPVSPAATLPAYDATWPFHLTDLIDRAKPVLLLFGSLTTVGDLSIIVPRSDVLLTQRSLALRNHPGQVSFPHGGLNLATMMRSPARSVDT